MERNKSKKYMCFCFKEVCGLIKEAFATEETIALAKQKACEILGADEKDVKFEIIQSPERKRFGLFGGKMAQVRAFLKESKSEKAKNYIKEILYYMEMEDLEVIIEKEEKELCVLRIDGDNIKDVVGWHGETLDAIQYLAGFVANNDLKEPFCKIRVEAGQYRERRKKSLEAFAKRMAHEVLRNGERIDLEPMRSYERKIIHLALKFVEGIESWSEGHDENRHVVIAPMGE